MSLISFAVTAKLICTFVFAYADCWFSYAVAHIISDVRLFLKYMRNIFRTGYVTKKRSQWFICLICGLMSQSTAMVMLGRCLHFMGHNIYKDVITLKMYLKYYHLSKPLKLICKDALNGNYE